VWHDPAAGDAAPRIRTCVIITTAANELVGAIHDRMPLDLPEPAWDAWLDRENHDVAALQRLLVPAPAETLECWPVSTRVNKADNNGPELLEPAEDVPRDLFRTTD
jgi:putative SOS response-associated peptidase YedK